MWAAGYGGMRLCRKPPNAHTMNAIQRDTTITTAEAQKKNRSSLLMRGATPCARVPSAPTRA